MSDPVAHVLEGFSHGELRVQRCEACEANQFPPRAVCLACGSTSLAWNVVPSRGTIVSFTTVHRAPTPEWKARVPYVIALVDCAPGVRLMMNVLTDAPEALAIGQAIEIDFATIGDDPQLRPVARAGFARPVRWPSSRGANAVNDAAIQTLGNGSGLLRFARNDD